MQTSETKSLYFFLSAALHAASKDVGTCARKLNPSSDQSEHFIKKKKKKTFPALVPGRVKYVPMGNKKRMREVV